MVGNYVYSSPNKGGLPVDKDSATSVGISLGSAMAMILSFELNHSVLWMVLHGVCSWFYVIFRVLEGNY